MLTHGRIVSEAVRLLDAEGVDALSMRKLGTRLGAGATSLYRHVANKDEPIELAVDEIFGELRLPDMGDQANWRTASVACAHSMRQVILRHLWIASLLGAMAHLGPNVVCMSERMLTVLEAAGFSLAEANSAMNTVFAYVIGMTSSEATWLTMLARSGMTEQEWVGSLGPAVLQAVQPHPKLHELYSAQGFLDLRQAREEEFAYGLDRIIDGLAAARAHHR